MPKPSHRRTQLPHPKPHHQLRRNATTGAHPSKSAGNGTQQPRCKFEVRWLPSPPGFCLLGLVVIVTSSWLQEEARMTGDPLLVLDGLVQIFPQVSVTSTPLLDWFDCR